MTVTTFAYTTDGAVQTYTVPAGVTSVLLEAWGGGRSGSLGPQGKGGYAKGWLVVGPGTVLNVVVGVGGGPDYQATTGACGASDVRRGGTALANRVIVAGGGGGASVVDNGGGLASLAGQGADGGGASGVAGMYGGGAPGTQSSGYALGVGGPGSGSGYPNWGGSGGDGYWGGFGAYQLAGGGGSGYTGTLSNPSMSPGVWMGPGQVVITAVNTAPLAPTPTTPAPGTYLIASLANPFTWQVNDPDPGDYQTRADLRYKKAGDAVWTTLNSVATTASTYTLPASTWTAGFQYEYQELTYDNAGLPSPWSASQFVDVIASISAPTIATPAGASTQYVTPVSMSWTLPAGFTQEARQVQRCAAADGSGTMYYDSGTVVTTGLTTSVPLDATAGRTDYLRVRFRYFGNWSAWASISVTNQFGPPQTPMVVAVQTTANLPEVVVMITNPAAGGGYADTLLTDLDRTGPDGTRTRIAANLPPGAVYVDKFAGAGVNDYTATAYAANGASAQSY